MERQALRTVRRSRGEREILERLPKYLNFVQGSSIEFRYLGNRSRISRSPRLRCTVRRRGRWNLTLFLTMAQLNVKVRGKRCRSVEHWCNLLANRPRACNAVALSFGTFLSVRLQK